MKPISRAIKQSGLTQTEFAAEIGYSQSQVSHWVTGIKPVPPKACRAIEALPSVTVTRYDLRPEIFGDQETAA